MKIAAAAFLASGLVLTLALCAAANDRRAPRSVRPSPTSPERGEGEPAQPAASTPNVTRSDLLAGVTGGEGAPAGQTQ